MYNFIHRLTLQKIKAPAFILLAAWLLNGSATLASTQKDHKKDTLVSMQKNHKKDIPANKDTTQKKKKTEKEKDKKKRETQNNQYLSAAIATGVLITTILGANYLVSDEDGAYQENIGEDNEDREKIETHYFEEEKRVVRLPKIIKKFQDVVPLIAEQQLNKIKIFTPTQISEIKNEVTIQVSNYTQKSLDESFDSLDHTFAIEKGDYLGLALIKVRNDPRKKKDHMCVGCWVKTAEKRLYTPEEFKENHKDYNLTEEDKKRFKAEHEPDLKEEAKNEYKKVFKNKNYVEYAELKRNN